MCIFTLQNLLQLDIQGFGFGPVIEVPHQDAFITSSAFKIFESGKFNRVPLILGMTTLETITFIDGNVKK